LVLSGSPTIVGKMVRVAFDAGRLTSDAGVLPLADVERRLGIAERLARCIEDPRAPDRVHHTVAEMIRFRVLLIAAGYPDANDCDALRSDAAFKMAVGRAPDSGRTLCSQPTMCRLENLPTITALKRMMAAMVELFCDSFAEVPTRIVLDIDDTEDRVHGRQELALFHAHYNEHCFLPIHVYEATTGKPVGEDLREGKPTVLLALARDLVGPQHASLLGTVGTPGLDDGDVARLRALLVDCGARHAVEQLIADRHEHALAALDGAPVAEAISARLRSLAARAAWREA